MWTLERGLWPSGSRWKLVAALGCLEWELGDTNPRAGLETPWALSNYWFLVGDSRIQTTVLTEPNKGFAGVSDSAANKPILFKSGGLLCKEEREEKCWV